MFTYAPPSHSAILSCPRKELSSSQHLIASSFPLDSRSSLLADIGLVNWGTREFESTDSRLSLGCDLLIEATNLTVAPGEPEGGGPNMPSKAGSEADAGDLL